jgi:hypothetical protein
LIFSGVGFHAGMSSYLNSQIAGAIRENIGSAFPMATYRLALLVGLLMVALAVIGFAAGYALQHVI